MSFFPPAKFDITANATQALAQFAAVGKALDGLNGKALTAGGGLSLLEKSAKLSAAAFKYLGTAMVGVGVMSLKTLENVEQAQTRLNTAITNAGVSYGAAQPAIEGQVKAMRDLGFTAEQTYEALGNMIRVTRSPAQALKDLSLAADMARAGNISLVEASNMLAKAALGQTKALGQFGIQMGVTIKKGASYEEIIKALQKRVEGASAAFRNTLSGSIQVANANFENLRIQIGTMLLPYAIKFTDWITQTAIPKLTILANWFRDNKGVVLGFAGALAAIWTTSKIVAGVTAVVAAINVVIGAYRLLKTSALAAYVAQMLALNPLLGVAAAAAIGLLFNKAIEGLGGVTDKFFSPAAGMSYNDQRVAQIADKGSTNLTGSGVPYVPTGTTPGPKVQVIQTITVYAKDANSMTVALAKAARNGVTLGASAVEDAVAGALSSGRIGGGAQGGARFGVKAI